MFGHLDPSLWQPISTFRVSGPGKLGATTIAARHYSVATGSATMNLWLAPPGLLVKMTLGEKGEYVLTHYRQYRKLIPQIEVETPDHK